MTRVWVTIAVLAVIGAALKATGPVLVGGRDLPTWAMRIIALLAPALLTALVVVETFGHGKALVVDARAAGLAAAATALVLRAPMLVIVIAAAAVTAGVRALS